MPDDNTPAPSAPDAASSFRGWGTGSADLGRQMDFTGQVSDFLNAGAAGRSQTGMPSWRPMGMSASGDDAGTQTPTLHPFTLDRVQDFLSGRQQIPTWTGAPTWNWSGLSSPGATGTQSLLNLTGARLSSTGSDERPGHYDRVYGPDSVSDAETTAPSSQTPDCPSAAERAQARADYARSQLGSKRWAMRIGFARKEHWKCNEFVTDVHREADPCGEKYPTTHHGYLAGPTLDFLTSLGVDDAASFPNLTKPTVADLASPEFAKDKMDYLDIKDVQPGDIIVWYDSSRGVHHTWYLQRRR